MALMTTNLAFAPGISCCEIDDQLILLDQRGDQYFALNPEEEQSLQHLLSATPLSPCDQLHLADLTEIGMLIVADAGDRPQLCEEGPPSRALTSETTTDITTLTQLQFACRVMLARKVLNWTGLNASLRRFRRRKASLRGRAADALPALREAAGLLRRITAYTTSHDQCLPLALGLAHHLLSRRVPSQLVLGVQLGPFQAHCWLQHDDHLIGDDLDVVRTFKPILVL